MWRFKCCYPILSSYNLTSNADKRSTAAQNQTGRSKVVDSSQTGGITKGETSYPSRLPYLALAVWVLVKGDPQSTWAIWHVGWVSSWNTPV